MQNLFDRAPPASNQQRRAQLGCDPLLSDPLGEGLRAEYAFR
jgi:hypothetical protein